jgi:hypothetical protein
MWAAAFVVIGQAVVRFALTPHDSSQGEGDYEAVAAASNVWLSLIIGSVLLAVGWFLWRKESSERNP